MKTSLPLLALVASTALLLVVVLVSAQQAPNPPPIWPAQFKANFGLYQLDTPSESPIFNETSQFYYNIDVTGQLIEYGERCINLLPGDSDTSPCAILFLESGIYINQPKLGVDCCLLIPNIGPTPRNFTRGFIWNGTATAPDYHGDSHDCDFYTAPDFTFKYWTAISTPPAPTSHHDIFFRDGSATYWAWDHLNVTAIDPSTFDLFSDPATCAVSCGDFLGLEEREQAEMDERVRRHGPIAMALHHHNMAQKEREQQQAHHHKHHHGHHQTTPKKLH